MSRGAFACFALVPLLGCGGPPPRSTAPPQPAASAAEPACAKGDECYALGVKLADEGKRDAARRAFARGCQGAEPAPSCCTAYALMLAKGEGGPKDEALATDLSEKSCIADDAGGCLIHGLLVRDGAKDLDRALADFDKACRRGLAPACRAKAEIATDKVVAEAESGMSFSADSLTVDGLVITKLQCKLESAAGMLGALAMGKTLSSRAAAMKKCTKKPADVPISWTSKGGAATDVTVEAQDAALKACVEKALAGAAATVPGKCSAIVKLAP